MAAGGVIHVSMGNRVGWGTTAAEVIQSCQMGSLKCPQRSAFSDTGSIQNNHLHQQTVEVSSAHDGTANCSCQFKAQNGLPEFLQSLRHSDIKFREVPRAVRREKNIDPVVDIAPFRMVVELLRQERCPGHPRKSLAEGIEPEFLSDRSSAVHFAPTGLKQWPQCFRSFFVNECFRSWHCCFLS